MMITDAPPRRSAARFLESDRIASLELPQNGTLPAIAKMIESAMRDERRGDVRIASADFLRACSEFYRVPACGISILAARPLRVRERWETEIFGDYNPATMLIRVWMKTARTQEVTSLGTFLSTLCHEFCHHLDFKRFKFPDSWHTRGFYARTAALYHHARGTPPKRLYWVALPRGRFRIDWPRTNRSV
jgi:hypothetical protein